MTRSKGKLAMILKFGGYTCVYGILFFIIVPEVSTLPVRVYVCSPFSISLMPLNSGMAALGILIFSTVLSVLFSRGWPKIFPPVVKSISVPMIALHFLISQSKNKAVHQWTTMAHSGVKRLCAWIPLCVPRKFHDTLVIAGINNRYLTFGQRDKFDILVSRLNNRFAGDAILGHSLSTTEIAAFSRVSILSELEA
jgi:hypothetical protein